MNATQPILKSEPRRLGRRMESWLMSHLSRRRIGAALFVLWGMMPTMIASAAFDQDHALLTRVLKQHVAEGLVNYPALKKNPADLDRYLDQLASLGKEEFGGWTEPAQIAFLINAYNGFTLRLILDHYPVKSIKDIGGFFSGPWDQPVVRLFGETLTLNRLEHKILRRDYAEPRIHFALVCAAQGCPPLRDEAYVGTRLDEQLDDQGRKFLGSTSKNRMASAERVVYLSPIFKWYGVDFEKKHGSLFAALEPYWPAAAGAGVKEDYKIRYTRYDWSLNDLSPKP